MKAIGWTILGLIVLLGIFWFIPRQTQDETVPEETVSVTIETERGEIQLELFPALAPNTVANFLAKARGGFYDGLTFHRVEDWVVQGGDPLGNGTGGGEMPTELNDGRFIAGAVGVARGQNVNISNDAQFFITKTDANWLDKQYTYFGRVVVGMDVVNSLEIGDRITRVTVQD